MDYCERSAPVVRAHRAFLRITSRRVVLVGHSMAGIIVIRTANRLQRPPALVIGVEANRTRADAYFTGLAAQFDEPAAFYAEFRARILRMSKAGCGCPSIRMQSGVR